LSPDLLNVFFAPDGVVAVARRGWRGRVGEKRSYPAAVAAGEAWTGAMTSFSTALGEFACPRVRVILSNHLVNYQLQPWREDLEDDDEEVALARMSLVGTYGHVADTWTVRLSDQPPAQTRIAAAIDTELLASLGAAVRGGGFRLVSVEPYLAAGVNTWRRQFGRQRSVWLALHEPGRLCLSLIERGHWRWLRSVRVGDDWRECLPDLIEDEVLLAGAEALPAEVLVFAPATPELSMRAGTRLPFRSLLLEARRGFSPLADAAFAPALIG